MVTLKLEVKENPKDDKDIQVKLITPKDLSKSTEQEQSIAKWLVESINGLFEKKGEENK